MNVSKLIRERLQEKFNPIVINIVNQSEQHASHISEELPFYGQTHFSIQIQAEELENLTKIEQHRRIFSCLNDLIPSPIHALSIDILST